MSMESSLAQLTQSRLKSNAGILSKFSFVEQSENVAASKTRRQVRAHAMRAVRRQQRQETAKVIRLKWPEERSSSKKVLLVRPHEQIFEVSEQHHVLQPEERIQKASQEGNVVGTTPPLGCSEPAGSLCKFDLQQSGSQRQAMTPYGRMEPADVRLSQASSRYTTAENEEEVRCTSARISTFLGSGRIDPFQTYQIRADRSVQELVDHYITIMPATFYGVRCRKLIHVYLYRIAISHQASTYAMAAYASRSLDFLHCSKPTQCTIYHTLKAIQSVSEGLVATSHRIYEGDDGGLLSVAMLALAELRFGRIDVARQHWIGLREVIRSRGGFDSIRCNRTLKVILAWNSTAWSASRHGTLPSLVAPESPDDLRLACQVFIDFFRKLNFNTYGHSVYSDPSDPSRPACPYKVSSSAHKQSLFAPGTPLHRLLQTESDSSLGISNQHAFDACQMPCLFYINVVMMEYANQPYLIDDFLSKLLNVVYEDNLHTCVSPEHLLLRLLVGIDGTEAVRDARLCKVTRFAYMAKRLGQTSQERVRGALWRNLVLADGHCRRECLFTWDPLLFEAEILGD